MAKVLRVIAMAGVLALAGCASAPASPISADDRAHILNRIQDEAWSHVDYPEALRPLVPAGKTLADKDWIASVVTCLKNVGFDVTQRGYTFGYRSSQGQTPLEFAVRSYVCTVRNPRLGAVAVYLDDIQRGHIYDYYSQIVRPCLLLAGQPSPVAPERGEFVDRFFLYTWHPYDDVWAANLGTRQLAAIERDCPPVPTWLNL
jgi:hypothetical protein